VELEAQLEKAEKVVEEHNQKLAASKSAAKKEISRLRGRLRTQESVYAQLRGELEAKKDRLKTQREELERLRAYKVTLIDVAPEPAGPSSEAGVTAESEPAEETAVEAEPEVPTARATPAEPETAPEVSGS